MEFPENLSHSAKHFLLSCLDKQANKRHTAKSLLHHSFLTHCESEGTSPELASRISEMSFPDILLKHDSDINTC